MKCEILIGLNDEDLIFKIQQFFDEPNKYNKTVQPMGELKVLITYTY